MNNDFDVNARIKQLCKERNITYYELAKRSDIPYSTLSTMLHKSNQPSLITLRKICDGLGITLSYFFNTEDTAISLTESHTVEYSTIRRFLSLSNERGIISFIISKKLKTATLVLLTLVVSLLVYISITLDIYGFTVKINLQAYLPPEPLSRTRRSVVFITTAPSYVPQI